MHEQRGSFQGIDTCDVTNFGDFGYCSKLLNESESRSIKHRPDINALLDNLVSDNLMSPGTVKHMREWAMTSGPSDDVMKKCLHGATYVGLEDALLMQYEVGQDKSIKVLCDNESPDYTNVIHTKIIWIQSIIHCQTTDIYGARFPLIPSFVSTSTDTILIWMLSGMFVYVKELCRSIDTFEMVKSKWHGWLLTFLTRKCFPSVNIRPDRITPFKGKFVTNVPSIMQKMCIEVGSSFDYSRFSDFLWIMIMLLWCLTVFY